MSYHQQWRVLAARIHSLTKAGQLYGQLNHAGDGYSVHKLLAQQCQSILRSIENFWADFRGLLPPDLSNCFDNFLTGNDGRNVAVIMERSNAATAQFGLVALLALESEVSFLLSDGQEQIFARSERGFLHLQRLLVVDNDLREKWISAFKRRETECEKLGAVHLLWHGIFAFKVGATAGATDLVFNEPIEDSGNTRGVEGLVLTEWKLGEAKNSISCFEDARRQAQLYENTVLAGIELRRYRYAIVVSLKELPPKAIPDDTELNGVIYRHINIALDRRDISVRARS